MNQVKKLLLALISNLLLACATNSVGFKKTEQVEAQLLLMSGAEVWYELGRPTVVKKLSQGRQHRKYFSQPNGLAGGSCTINLVIERDDSIISAEVLSESNAEWLFPLKPCRLLLENLSGDVLLQEQE